MHFKIKKLRDEQTFNLYLIDSKSASSTRKQFIKTISVEGTGDIAPDGWVDFEIVFNPLVTDTFNTLLFSLSRNISDYSGNGFRFPMIVYQEFSIIGNLITNVFSVPVNSLLKIGVQSRPGLVMCINGEEIHVGRTGIYEVKNGVVKVSFFGVVSGATETDGNFPAVSSYAGTITTFDDYLKALLSVPVNTSDNSTHSVCLFNHPKQRAIDAFTIDYLYNSDEGGI